MLFLVKKLSRSFRTSCCSSCDDLQQNITGVQRVGGHQSFDQLDKQKIINYTHSYTLFTSFLCVALRLLSGSRSCWTSVPLPLSAAVLTAHLHLWHQLNLKRESRVIYHIWMIVTDRSAQIKRTHSLCSSDRTSSWSLRACSILSNTLATGSSSVCLFMSTFLSVSLR